MRSWIAIPLLLVILISQPILAQQNIAGALFFTTREGIRTNYFNPGDTIELRAESESPVGPYTIKVYLSFPPGTGRGEIFVGEQSSITIHPSLLIVTYPLNPNAPSGRYSFHVKVYDAWGRLVQEGYVDFQVSPPITSPPSPPPEGGGPEWMYIILAIGIIAVAGVISAIVLMRKPKVSPEIRPLPSLPGPSEGGTIPITAGPVTAGPGGTIQIPGPGGGTIQLTAMFKVGDKIVPISTLPQSFGREDFAGIAPPEVLNAISRRARPQFTVSFDYANKTFIIEDNNSVNGTLLNGENIRGKGPRPLRNGDIVSPAGVLNMRFVSEFA